MGFFRHFSDADGPCGVFFGERTVKMCAKTWIRGGAGEKTDRPFATANSCKSRIVCVGGIDLEFYFMLIYICV